MILIFIFHCIVTVTVSSKTEKRNFISSYGPPQLPEIVINRANHNVPSAYGYPIPNLRDLFGNVNYNIPAHEPSSIDAPIFQDDIPKEMRYLPPIHSPPDTPEIDINSITYNPIPTNTPVISNPPPLHSPSSAVFGSNIKQAELKILNMSCLDRSSNRFFRALILTPQLFNFAPVAENSINNCISGSGNTFHINLDDNEMTQCGVRYCSERNLCLQLRLPTVEGLKLPEDMLLTLKCKPQDNIASHFKKFQFNSHNVQGRELGVIASGGSQRKFETQISLFRKNPESNDFTQVVSPGSSVQLGEDLLLRTAVREGDGWKNSRMGTIIMQRISPSREISSKTRALQDSVTLVDSLGCRSPSMRSVCPEQPRQVNPLVTTFPFRAFMFQGAQSGDEMILSVQIQGCVQYEDCYQVQTCDEPARGRTRAKRYAETGAIKDNITDWQSYLEFRVVVPGFNKTGAPAPDSTSHIFSNLVIIVLSSAGIFLLILFLVIVIKNYFG